jgi:hypothetical protein
MSMQENGITDICFELDRLPFIDLLPSSAQLQLQLVALAILSFLNS